jgi:hypothetical protein
MCSLFHFLNSNSGAIQAILVLILVSVTIWYAISTKEMAKTMNRQFLSSTKPYIYPAIEIDRQFAPNFNASSNNSIQLKFQFTNVGTVPAKYYVEKVMLNGSPITTQKTDLILFPGQKSYFGSEILHSNTNIGLGDGLKGNIKLIFWSGEPTGTKYFFQRDFTLSPNNVVAIDNENFGQYE